MRIKERGDTIIEVLLAFTVFSLLSVGTMVVMNQGSNASQRALEITLVRQQIDAQVEALRSAQQAYVQSPDPARSEWSKIAQVGDASDSAYFTSTEAQPCPASDVMNGGASRTFIMDSSDGSVVEDDEWFGGSGADDAPPYAQIREGVAYGIWIERTYIDSENDAPDSYDFTVRTCWPGAGLNAETPMQIETSVRLYEPRA